MKQVCDKGHFQWQCLRWSTRETEKPRPRLEAYPTKLCCSARLVPKVLLPSKTVHSAADQAFKLVTLWGTFPIWPATALLFARLLRPCCDLGTTEYLCFPKCDSVRLFYYTLKWFFFIFKDSVFLSLCLCLSVYTHMHAHVYIREHAGAHQGQKWASGSLDLELQIVSYELPDVGTVNWTRVLWKRNKYC